MKTSITKPAASTVRAEKLNRWIASHSMLLAMVIATLATVLFVAVTSHIGTGLGQGLFK